MDKELIDKYLQGRCNSAETRYIRRYFKEHPLELETYFTHEEWNNYVNENKGKEPHALSDEMYRAIYASIFYKQNGIYKVVKWAGAAAAIILLFFGFKLFYAEKTLPQKDIITKATEEIKINKNTSTSVQAFSLPDGTLVLLSPGSEIKYLSGYNTIKRDVYLQGKAEFDVAHNKENPFTVFCGKISTQALGTRFEVNGFVKNTSVVLFEGKVVVKNIENEKVRAILKAGDKTAYNNDKKIFETVLHSESHMARDEQRTENKNIATEANIPINTNAEKFIIKKLSASTKSTNAYLKFENQSLRSVINQLSELYDVEINYPTEISSTINVYISIDPRQPIEKILKNISSINGLEINKIDSNKYILSK